VPEEPGVLAADRAAVLDDVRDHEDLGIARLAAVLAHVLLERAEAAAERDVLLGRQALVAEEDHLVLVPGRLDGAESFVVQRPRQVHPEYFGAQRGAGRAYG
jgi:hypothetical protein